MQFTRTQANRIRLVERHRTAIAGGIGNYQTHSDADLAKAHQTLIADLGAADGFGPTARAGMRRLCLEQLQAVGDEFARRAGARQARPHAA
ncbi:MAG: hypothetical protein M3464_11770 [Chloroflexota bacterium]|nr:hypothetical protein [Chloroflexota bacterium]